MTLVKPHGIVYAFCVRLILEINSKQGGWIRTVIIIIIMSRLVVKLKEDGFYDNFTYLRSFFIINFIVT
jgi:hypothetical protein